MKPEPVELSFAERCKQYRAELKELTMMSDAFMRTVLKEKRMPPLNGPDIIAVFWI